MADRPVHRAGDLADRLGGDGAARAGRRDRDRRRPALHAATRVASRSGSHEWCATATTRAPTRPTRSGRCRPSSESIRPTSVEVWCHLVTPIFDQPPFGGRLPWSRGDRDSDRAQPPPAGRLLRRPVRRAARHPEPLRSLDGARGARPPGDADGRDDARLPAPGGPRAGLGRPGQRGDRSRPRPTSRRRSHPAAARSRGHAGQGARCRTDGPDGRWLRAPPRLCPAARPGRRRHTGRLADAARLAARRCGRTGAEEAPGRHRAGRDRPGLVLGQPVPRSPDRARRSRWRSPAGPPHWPTSAGRVSTCCASASDRPHGPASHRATPSCTRRTLPP